MHLFGDLSAYLDNALGPEARASVQAHLDVCALCRTRLAELRGTARLIAALPAPVPSRSLVPRVSVPRWLAPLRTLSTFASAAAMLVFVITLASSFGITTQSAAPAFAPAASNASAPEAASGRTGDTSASAGPQGFNAASPVPAPAASDSLQRGAGRTDAVKQVGPPQDAASPSAAPADTATRVNLRESAPPRSFAPPAWVWLVLGVAFGALSLALGRRLRSA